MSFGKDHLQDFYRAATKEWLVTNGLGGYASATIAGANTRKYHGLLVAAMKPPTDRYVLLAKVEEAVVINGQRYELGTNEAGGAIYPEGYRYLFQFSPYPLPTFFYHIEDVIIAKTVFMVYGENTTVIRYQVFTSDEKEITLELVPLVNCRDYHHTLRRNEWPFNQSINKGQVEIEAYPGSPKLYLAGDGLEYEQGPGHWFEGMHYLQEQARGEPDWEDHYLPGVFRTRLRGSGEFALLASTEEIVNLNSELLRIQAEKRLSKLVELAGFGDEFLNRLVLAADNFIVTRQSTGTSTVIAGYPWFTDWGRDTMIALPGLTLMTKRYEDAKEILRTFARYCQDGLIPNRFPDGSERPDYNTVDASLWFFHAVYKFLEYTEEWEFVKEHIYPVLKDIVAAHLEGTQFNIKVDADGLVSAGGHDLQLTWMDAKVDDWVVTPRHGKPVEINALWYNALAVMAELARKFGDDPAMYIKQAKLTQSSFVKEFWYQDGGYLYDVIGEQGKDASLRPNQIIAVALPFTMLDHAKEVRVVNKVWQELYTPYGLRSLSSKDPAYVGRYGGDRVKRDGSYHQGTVWSWLMGPFVTAYRKIHDYSGESRTVADNFLLTFRGHLYDHGVGGISEIFDGDPPYYPNGCINQAWGVAEVLRAYVEDVMEIRRS